MARATFVKSARKAVPHAGIAVGDSYWWWKFRFGGKQYSKTQPKPSQLTQSAFYWTLYDLQDMQAQASANDGLEAARDDLVSSLEDLKSECESNYENIPESLQSGSSGELLQERISELESRIDELESIDFSDMPDREEPELEREEGESDEDFNARENMALQEYNDEVQSYWESKLEEFQAVDLSIG